MQHDFQATLCTVPGPVARILIRRGPQKEPMQRWQSSFGARVCFFRIPQAACDKSGFSTELIASRDMDFSVPPGSVAWQGHWDIAPY